MYTILITGGAGFIGSHTADLLLRAGHRVRILDNLDPQIHGPHPTPPDYLHPDIEIFHGDIRDRNDVKHALAGIDAVYHFASMTGVGQSMYAMSDYVDVNVKGTAHVLEAIAQGKHQLKRLVLASSRAIYGEGAYVCPEHGAQHPGLRERRTLERTQFSPRCLHCGLPLSPTRTSEATPAHPVSIYGWTKKHQEDQCRFAAKAFGIPVTILRYFNVYGPRQSLTNPYTGIVSTFYSRLHSGESVALYEQGRPERDFIHVADVARANVLALDTRLPNGEALNVGSGDSITIARLAGTLRAALKAKGVLRRTNKFRVGDIYACVAETSKAQSMLNFSAKIPLADGLAQFSVWANGQPCQDRSREAENELSRHGLLGAALETAATGG